MSKINQAIAQAQGLLQQIAFNPILEGNLALAFGGNYNINLADGLFAKFGEGKFQSLPTVVVLPTIEMNGAIGAYSTTNNTVYLINYPFCTTIALIMNYKVDFIACCQFM